MKVCLLTANFPPELHGGTELVAAALARALAAAGVEVIVLTTSEVLHSGVDVMAEEYDGIPVRRLFRRPGEWETGGLVRPRLLALVDDLLSELRPDVLHAHHLAGFGTRILAGARRRGIPSVLTFHDLWVTCPRFFRLPPPGHQCPTGAGREPCAACVNVDLGEADLERVRGAIADRDRELRAEVAAAAVLTAPSRTAAALVAAHLPWAGPIEVVPHGLLCKVESAARAPAPVPGQRLRVGTFGNLVPAKGVLELVEAVADLPCELHLYGPFLDSGFARQVHDRALALGVELRCHGPYQPADAHPARNLHLCVFPSRCQETYGLVVDEALAHGVPAVVSDQGALAERASAPGVLVTPLPGLPAVLRGLLTEPGRLAALRAAVPAALPGIEAGAARYLALYRAAASGSRP